MQFDTDEDFARRLDAADKLREFRARFQLPQASDGEPLIYFAGNSLGPMPRMARRLVEHELDEWAKHAVDAHHLAAAPWYTYHETVREPLARLVGGKPHEVICMNSLTVNLHLMLASFYRPNKSRFKILVEYPSFPSDTYAIKSQIAHHGFDPKEALVVAAPREGETTLREDDIDELIARNADQLALVLLGAVNFFTGQSLDLKRIAATAHRHGVQVGFDLAHAIGNVPLSLHDWDVDFAVWCSYKYLNAGPGAVAGAYLHERHATNTRLPRLAGWFGNDPNTRFRMHLELEFIPVASADAWQVSNPAILAMAPLRASLAVFDEAGGMPALREKSERLTGYLEFLLREIAPERFTVITPKEHRARGAQLSIVTQRQPKEFFAKLHAGGVRCDFREPNVIRVAPAPLFNTFHEVWRFGEIARGGA